MAPKKKMNLHVMDNIRDWKFSVNKDATASWCGLLSVNLLECLASLALVPVFALNIP